MEYLPLAFFSGSAFEAGFAYDLRAAADADAECLQGKRRIRDASADAVFELQAVAVFAVVEVEELGLGLRSEVA